MLNLFVYLPLCGYLQPWRAAHKRANEKAQAVRREREWSRSHRVSDSSGFLLKTPPFFPQNLFGLLYIFIFNCKKTPHSPDGLKEFCKDKIFCTIGWVSNLIIFTPQRPKRHKSNPNWIINQGVYFLGKRRREGEKEEERDKKTPWEIKRC